ncbi:hypothetical protein FNAPI_688 [Fusarium napiforme]|uniref:Uncharacterized protein n=1 Tax=Fusarium napiforme TaxID=42672 RepID=A0A8H5NJ42_9HYPO|nr:hypothetical protein FNAPI_688 [Fusarium napiforme]
MESLGKRSIKSAKGTREPETLSGLGVCRYTKGSNLKAPNCFNIELSRSNRRASSLWGERRGYHHRNSRPKRREGDGAANDHEFNDEIYNGPSQHDCAGAEATAVNALLPLSQPPLDPTSRLRCDPRSVKDAPKVGSLPAIPLGIASAGLPQGRSHLGDICKLDEPPFLDIMASYYAPTRTRLPVACGFLVAEGTYRASRSRTLTNIRATSSTFQPEALRLAKVPRAQLSEKMTGLQGWPSPMATRNAFAACPPSQGSNCYAQQRILLAGLGGDEDDDAINVIKSFTLTSLAIMVFPLRIAPSILHHLRQAQPHPYCYRFAQFAVVTDKRA